MQRPMVGRKTATHPRISKAPMDLATAEHFLKRSVTKHNTHRPASSNDRLVTQTYGYQALFN